VQGGACLLYWLALAPATPAGVQKEPYNPKRVLNHCKRDLLTLQAAAAPAACRLQCHLDSKALSHSLRAGGVELFPEEEEHPTAAASADPATVRALAEAANAERESGAASAPEEGLTDESAGRGGVHPLLRMAGRLEALGNTELDVLSRMGLEAQEFEVRLVRGVPTDAPAETGATAPGAGAAGGVQRQGAVGLEVGRSEEGICVKGVVPGGAAAKSNALLKEDVLLEIDGQLVKRWVTLVCDLHGVCRWCW